MSVLEEVPIDPAAWAAPAALGTWQSRARLAALVGGVATLAGAFLQREQFFRSYLVAWLLWLGVAVGCLAILMIQHLSGGAWGLTVRRTLEAAGRTLPALFALSLPLLVAGLPTLYVWARPAAVAADPLLRHKAAYLNVPFFVGRVLVFFAVLGAIAWLLARWSAQQDEAPAVEQAQRMRALSGAGLVLLVLLGTMASIDWLMSLDPHWYSSMYGFLFVAGQGLSGLTVTILVAYLLAREAPMSRLATSKHFHDYGKLLLAFVMFWTYLAISQYIILWQANLPEEVVWYQARTTGGWQYVAGALILLHFLFPFLMLLSASLKKKPKRLAAVALLVLGMRWIDLLWQVGPAFSPGKLTASWLDVAALVGLGGVWGALFLRQLARRPLLPVHDPAFVEVLGHG